METEQGHWILSFSKTFFIGTPYMLYNSLIDDSILNKNIFNMSTNKLQDYTIIIHGMLMVLVFVMFYCSIALLFKENKALGCIRVGWVEEL